MTGKVSGQAKIELRCELSLVAAADAAARAAGISRSAWVRAQVVEGVGRVELKQYPAPGNDGLARAIHDRQRIEVRLSKLLLKRLDQEASATELSRANYIRAALHGRLYAGERFRVLSGRTKTQFDELKSKLSALERMVNKVERAVKAIVRDGKYPDLEGRVEDLSEMAENILGAFETTQSFIIWASREEHIYWRGSEADGVEQNSPDDDFYGGLSADDVGAGE